ncbi:MAG: rod shape-determining protein RodA, partial [Actinomycetota bacterium]
YQLKRITAFLQQNSDSADLQNLITQVKFAKRAVATGGFFGKGYLQGPLTNGRFIPVQSTDFVFSALGEQFGMIGCATVLGLFGVVLWRIYRIARIANEKLGVLVCAGVFTMILWQAFQNIGMTMHPRVRCAPALRLLRGVPHGGLRDDDRPCPERAHAPFPLTRGVGFRKGRFGLVAPPGQPIGSFMARQKARLTRKN